MWYSESFVSFFPLPFQPFLSYKYIPMKTFNEYVQSRPEIQDMTKDEQKKEYADYKEAILTALNLLAEESESYGEYD